LSKKRLIIPAIFLLSIFLVLHENASYASAEEKDNKIYNGVFIDEVNVSGMTKEEAAIAVDNMVQGLQQKNLVITVGKNAAKTTLKEIGYTYDLNDSIEQAYALGRSGNLIKRYKEIKDIEQESEVFSLDYHLDDAKLKEFVATEVAAFNVKPVNATVARKNNQFVYTDHKVGSKVNVDKTVELVKNIVFDNWNRMDITLQADMEEDMPKYTRKDVEKINTILGTYSTEYASSAEGRAANLANGARLINNTVIYPEEVFSSYKYLTPFTPENGYYSAGAYSEGKVIDSIGGGACQVTTTLYNAVLYAELNVVERAPHSMTISYTDLSRDAAIAGTYKDFKFMNSLDTPILIEAYTQGRRITFNIWGQETRDTKKRKIKYETVILSETAPPADVITKDPTKPVTYRRVTQSAHTGYRAELYKIVYENGTEVSRTLVNKSTYMAAPRYITIGTKAAEEAPKEENTPKNDKKKDKNKQTEEQTDNQADKKPNNRANPEEQLQADVFWDPDWDKEGYEDE